MKTFEILQSIRKTLNENERLDFDNSLNEILICAKLFIRTKVTKSKFNARHSNKVVLSHLKNINSYSKKHKLTFEEKNLELAEKQIVNIIRQVVEK